MIIAEIETLPLHIPPPAQADSLASFLFLRVYKTADRSIAGLCGTAAFRTAPLTPDQAVPQS